MTSMFESEVYQRENYTPYARIDLVRFMKDMAINGSNADNSTISLHLNYRHSVASRFWWTISWVDPNGERQDISAQHLDKCLWRAVTLQVKLQDKADGKPTRPEYTGWGKEVESDIEEVKNNGKTQRAIS